MSNLGIGKIRGLQQISTPEGAFVISAIDHRGSLQSAIEKELGVTETNIFDWETLTFKEK